MLGPLHTRDWEPVTSTLQALSLVEKAAPVQVRFTLVRLRDRRSMWMQGGCNVYMDSYMASKWIMFHGCLDYFQKPSLGGWPPTKPLGDHGTPKAQNRWFSLFYHMWGPAWIESHWNSIWLRARHIWVHTTLEDLWSHYMILEVSWDGLCTLSIWARTMSWSRHLACVWRPVTIAI